VRARAITEQLHRRRTGDPISPHQVKENPLPVCGQEDRQNELFRDISDVLQNPTFDGGDKCHFFESHSFLTPDPQTIRNDIFGSFGSGTAPQSRSSHQQNCTQNEKLQYGLLHPSHPSHPPHTSHPSKTSAFGTKRQHLNYYEAYDNTAVYPEYVIITHSCSNNKCKVQ